MAFNTGSGIIRTVNHARIPIMPTPTINPAFAPVLALLGNRASDFFLAAGLYHARKISFAAAASLAGLGYEEFHDQLREHFGYGFIIADETAREDLELVDALAGPRP